MGILLLFALGAAFGYVSHRFRPATPPRPLLDVALAIMAALFGGLFVAPRLGLPSLGWAYPDGQSILVAGGTALLAGLILFAVRRGVAPGAQ